MLASVRTFRENGLERMGELLGEIDTAFEKHTTEELRGQIDAVVSDLETLLAELEEWNLPDRAQEIVDAATAEGLDPEAAREIVDHVGTAAARNGDVAVGTIATVRDHASSLATWIDELSDATRRRIETAVPSTSTPSRRSFPTSTTPYSISRPASSKRPDRSSK